MLIKLIKYENLIVSLKNETSELLKFFGLSWEKGIDNFRNNGLVKKINTPSYNQVIKPLNTNSIGRWKNYNEMNNIENKLDEWIKYFKY